MRKHAVFLRKKEVDVWECPECHKEIVEEQDRRGTLRICENCGEILELMCYDRIWAPSLK